MDIEEALNIIENICSQVQLNREGHVKIQAAMLTIRAELNKPTVNPQPPLETPPEQPQE